MLFFIMAKHNEKIVNVLDWHWSPSFLHCGINESRVKYMMKQGNFSHDITHLI